jgi:hypothetical protein
MSQKSPIKNKNTLKAMLKRHKSRPFAWLLDFLSVGTMDCYSRVSGFSSEVVVPAH